MELNVLTTAAKKLWKVLQGFVVLELQGNARTLEDLIVLPRQTLEKLYFLVKKVLWHMKMILRYSLKKYTPRAKIK